MQSIGVHYGAKLEQHISHITNKQYERGSIVHTVPIIDSYRPSLVTNLGFLKHVVGVNSIHHQVLDSESINNSALHTIGTSYFKDEQGYDYVEIIAHPKLSILGVQWHPEEIYDEFSLKAIKYLLRTKRSILS